MVLFLKLRKKLAFVALNAAVKLFSKILKQSFATLDSAGQKLPDFFFFYRNLALRKI